MNTKTFSSLGIGDCFYFVNGEGKRLSGPHIKTHPNEYLATWKVINGDYVTPHRSLNQTELALVEVLPGIGSF